MKHDKTACDPRSEASCDACEAMFQENLHHIIDEAKAPRGAEHDAREKELTAAFGREHSATQANRENHPLGTMPNAKTE